MIPKILHTIWVGDDNICPHACIDSWKKHHPDWEFKVWGNTDLMTFPWHNKPHLERMWTHELAGMADIMRYEILFHFGGVAVDADSWCLQPIPEWLLECEAFCGWENERIKPGLLSTGTQGTIPFNLFYRMLIDGLAAKQTVVDREAWKSVGPRHLTEVWNTMPYDGLTILPSHFFLPKHHTGLEYAGTGPVIASQEWASTHHAYDKLFKKERL